MIGKRKIKINVLICIIILAGFISMVAISYNTYSGIIKDDIKNISKLTTTNIYSDLSNQLTKPIFVSLTMANDSFVMNWLEEEKNNKSSIEHQNKMTEYLNGLKEKYNYNSVFLVSDYSKIYYHYKGINKIISKDNAHDQWYYDYIASNLVYTLDVDTDEVNRNKLSVFINCKIVDDNGNLLGVTGVGLELNKVQEMLKKYKDDFQLEAMLIDKQGVIQVHSNTNLIEKKNLFDNEYGKRNKASILANKKTISVFQYKDKNYQGYMITKYIDDLDWYLVVKKDTSVLVKSFHSILLKDMVIFFIVIFFNILIITQLIKSNDVTLTNMAKTDTLTGLTNRRGFDEVLERILFNAKDKDNYYIFVFDIDDFKNVNDMHGHLIGDAVICQIASIIKDYLSENGKVFRWGGDEFTGYIYSKKDDLEDNLNMMFQAIKNDPELSRYHASISLGITPIQKSDTVDTLIKRADKALYRAKENGKDQYIIS